MSVAMSQNEKDCVEYVYNLPVCYIIYKYKKKKYIYIYIYICKFNFKLSNSIY